MHAEARPVSAVIDLTVPGGRTKAAMLRGLSDRLRPAVVLPLVSFSAARWQADSAACLAEVLDAFGEDPLIVRSSAAGEDGATASMAGRYRSVQRVRGRSALSSAVAEVIASYGSDVVAGDEVLVQPMLERVAVSGVAFSRDPATGGPYRVVNYSLGEDTTRVTAGNDDVETWVGLAGGPVDPPGELLGVLDLIDELEEILAWPAIDLEFAVQDDVVHLLQARPLIVRGDAPEPATHRRLLDGIADRIVKAQRPHPFLHGRLGVFGIMPDWNPAEIIGVRPRPLALSLYKELVTDSTWAYQRDNYGYRNLRSHPLLLHFHGLPYIDVRASFNSFIPRDIEGALAGRLVDYYTGELLRTPSLHDKVEFEIVFSCYTLDLPERLRALDEHGFTEAERGVLADSLRRLTNRIIDSENGLWRTDRERVGTLVDRHREVMAADFDPIERIYWLIEDCKRYGTLPFAGLARAAFIAVQMLRSLVSVGVFTAADYDAFLGGLNTISRQLSRDLVQLDRSAFLAQYGHLRPGTYDILSPRYDEEPDLYFGAADPANASAAAEHEPFALTLSQLREVGALLSDHGLSGGLVELFDFLQAGIELREHAKFLFTRNLSDALALLARFGEDHGFSTEDMSFADIRVIHALQSSCADPGTELARVIEQGRRRYADTRSVWLPPLITSPADVFGFSIPASDPNFITQQTVSAAVVDHHRPEKLVGSIVLIPSADPGYDWLFTHGIVGLVTAYGGVNSHMAIRANELGLPAVIGVGESLFARWAECRALRIDCAARKVDVLA